MLDQANDKIKALEHKSALVADQALAYDEEIKELQTKLVRYIIGFYLLSTP